MKSKEEVFNEIKVLIKNKFKKDITKDSNLRDLGIDSLDLIAFIIDVEKHFNIKINDEELIGLSNISDVVNAIEKKLNA